MQRPGFQSPIPGKITGSAPLAPVWATLPPTQAAPGARVQPCRPPCPRWAGGGRCSAQAPPPRAGPQRCHGDGAVARATASRGPAIHHPRWRRRRPGAECGVLAPPDAVGGVELLPLLGTPPRRWRGERGTPSSWALLGTLPWACLRCVPLTFLRPGSGDGRPTRTLPALSSAWGAGHTALPVSFCPV